MKIRSDSIVSNNGNFPVEFTNGATLPSGSQLNVQGNINATGISTIESLSATGINASGIVTATFVGDGSGVTNLPLITTGKAIALKYIIADPPLRS